MMFQKKVEGSQKAEGSVLALLTKNGYDHVEDLSEAIDVLRYTRNPNILGNFEQQAAPRAQQKASEDYLEKLGRAREFLVERSESVHEIDELIKTEQDRNPKHHARSKSAY